MKHLEAFNIFDKLDKQEDQRARKWRHKLYGPQRQDAAKRFEEWKNVISNISNEQLKEFFNRLAVHKKRSFDDILVILSDLGEGYNYSTKIIQNEKIIVQSENALVFKIDDYETLQNYFLKLPIRKQEFLSILNNNNNIYIGLEKGKIKLFNSQTNIILFTTLKNSSEININISLSETNDSVNVQEWFQQNNLDMDLFQYIAIDI